jgi:hypothetical protein
MGLFIAQSTMLFLKHRRQICGKTRRKHKKYARQFGVENLGSVLRWR